MERPLFIKTKIRTFVPLTLIGGGLGFLWISYYLISESLKPEFPQLALLVLSIFFGLFGLLSIISLWSLKKYEFDGEKLLVKSVFNTARKIIYVKDIKSYNEIVKGSDSYKRHDLTIFTEKHKETISSSAFYKYKQLKSELTMGIERDEHSERLWSYKVNKRFGIGFIIFGLLLSIILWAGDFKNEKIHSSELTTIKATIAETPQIAQGKSSKRISLKLLEYPEFKFNISGNRFYASHSDAIVGEISANDIIELDIRTDTYEKKITKTKDLTFVDKSFNYQVIAVNGLRKNGTSYLSIEDINREQELDSTYYKPIGLSIVIGFVILFTSFGIYYVTRKKPVAKSPIQAP